MPETLVSLYARVFARKAFYKIHQGLYYLSLRGLGILNYQDFKISGEDYFLKQALGTGMVQTVFDVGANHGSYALKVRKLNSQADIYAFEPHPETFRQLQDNTQKQGIHSFNLGFSDTNALMQLYDYIEDEGFAHASLYREVITYLRQHQVIEHQVKVVRLDDFVAAHAIERIDLLKIDTEGHEYQTLRGAKQTLAAGKIQMIHFEFNEMNVISRCFFKDFYDLLADYRFFRLLQDGLVPISSYRAVFCEIFAFQNLVAVNNMLLPQLTAQGLL